MVTKLGIARALTLTRVLHLAFLGLLIWFGALTGLGAIYYGAVALIGGFIVYEHRAGSARRFAARQRRVFHHERRD